MTTILIPTDESPNYSQRVKLDDVDYVFRFLWNGRSGRWYLSIFSAEEVALIRSLPLEVNRPLLYAYHANAELPSGELVAVATTDSTEPPGLEELGEGKRVELTYYPLTDA